MKNIFLVDDNPLDIYIHKVIISKSGAGFTIISSNSVTEAMDYLRKADRFPDTILLDIRMPELDGFDFLDLYLELPEKKRGECKVYLLSSSQNHDDIARAKSYSLLKGYLHKPLTPEIVDEIFR